MRQSLILLEPAHSHQIIDGFLAKILNSLGKKIIV